MIIGGTLPLPLLQFKMMAEVSANLPATPFVFIRTSAVAVGSFSAALSVYHCEIGE
jgi:hypothetical protein